MAKLPFFNPYMISNPTLPEMYWQVKSPEQLIANLYCMLDYIKDYINSQSDSINSNSDRIEELERLFSQFIESGFEDYYASEIRKWINENMLEIWQTFGRMAFVGLTDDGHFCVYVPDSWKEITFDTGAVYGTQNYGRLILRYDADGHGIIDNTNPAYPNDALAKDIANLKNEMHEVRHTLYTALTAQKGK